MAIQRVHATNFKSFSSLAVDLRPFNVLVGPNSAGKSSFVEIFRFLRDVATEGLDNAVSMQGGIENIRNARLGRETDMGFSVVYDVDLQLWGPDPAMRVSVERVEYAFSLHFKQRQRGRGFWIGADKLTLSAVSRTGGDTLVPETNRGQICIARESNSTGTYRVSVDDDLRVELNALVPYADRAGTDTFRIGDGILLEAASSVPFFFMQRRRGVGGWSDQLREVGVFDFDPKLAKRAVPLRGRRELDEDGGNLALVLRSILKNKPSARRFSNLVEGLLPFVSEMSVKEHVDKSALLRCREVYNDEYYVPGPLLSDGTVNIAALVVALHFERNPMTIIEEPERNLHPALVRQLVDMMRSAAQKNQLLVTTHNPELVKYSELEDLLLVSRDAEGFSSIVRPSENAMVHEFLRQDLGLDDLYVMNLLGGGL